MMFDTQGPEMQANEEIRQLFLTDFLNYLYMKRNLYWRHQQNGNHYSYKRRSKF